MENNLQIFENPEFGKVRAIMVDDKPWVVAADVCTAFGVKNGRPLVKDFDDDEKGVYNVYTLGGDQNVTCLSEAGLYRILLAMNPKKSKARGVSEEEIQKRCEQLHNFKRWITHEVLPSIRKNGGYIAGQEEMSPQELMAKALMVAQKTLEEREARIAGMTKQIEIMAPKASYYDAVLNSKGLVSITEIAKDYGMGGKTLNKILHDKKVQYKVNDTWVLYSEYAKKGYTGTKTATYSSSEGTTFSKESTYWTQKGRLFIYELLKKDGKLPIIEIENQ